MLLLGHGLPVGFPRWLCGCCRAAAAAADLPVRFLCAVFRSLIIICLGAVFPPPMKTWRKISHLEWKEQKKKKNKTDPILPVFHSTFYVPPFCWLILIIPPTKHTNRCSAASLDDTSSISFGPLHVALGRFRRNARVEGNNKSFQNVHKELKTQFGSSFSPSRIRNFIESITASATFSRSSRKVTHHIQLFILIIWNDLTDEYPQEYSVFS